MVKPVGTACHERHKQAASHEQRCRILIPLQAFRDVLYQRIFLSQSLNLSAPVPQPLVDVLIRSSGSQFFTFHYSLFPQNAIKHFADSLWRLFAGRLYDAAQLLFVQSQARHDFQE